MAEKKIKSALELALEKVGGVDRGSLSEAARARIAEVRRRFQAQRAELEIMHKSSLSALGHGLAAADAAAAREKVEQDYRARLERLREDEERELEKARREADPN